MPTVSAPGTPEFGVTFALTPVLVSETPEADAPAAICPVSSWARLVDPDSVRLLEASPTLIEYAPAWASHWLSVGDQEARSWMVSGKVTVVLAPGLSVTRWKPLSCSGGSSLAAGSPTYICATSAPATDPVLVMVAVTLALPSELKAPTDRLEKENFVYDSPYPNENCGVMFWDWYQR